MGSRPTKVALPASREVPSDEEFARADVAFLIIMMRNQRGPDSACWDIEGHISSRYPGLSHDEELLSLSLGHFGPTVHSTPDSHADGARLGALTMGKEEPQ